ncbi:hypothetical protein AA13594_2942 [Gluconacetobacter azotocaptans DSM 13594]|nr:hypothetical protein AA13594_2942 [Gluconacetobacter azotocaptans DSM 13594]
MGGTGAVMGGNGQDLALGIQDGAADGGIGSGGAHVARRLGKRGPERPADDGGKTRRIAIRTTHP